MTALPDKSQQDIHENNSDAEQIYFLLFPARTLKRKNNL